jgi:hypothetical protein
MARDAWRRRIRKANAVDILAVAAYHSSPTKLPTAKFGRKEYTIDPRLKEFRFIRYGKPMEFIPFNSVKGRKMLKKMM